MFCARLFICALWSPAGKGLTSWLSFVVSSVSLSLSHWYPGSGVVLDCIDSCSLQPYYFEATRQVEDNFTSQQTYQHLQRSNRLSLHYLQKSLQDNVRVLNQKSNFLLSKKKVIYPMQTGVWNTLTWSGNKMTSIS